MMTKCREDWCQRSEQKVRHNLGVVSLGHENEILFINVPYGFYLGVLNTFF
jgi:hypothetical protein